MNILSLFDGISCARVALDRAGIPISRYFASEIDKYSIQIANKNYPDTVHIGGVEGVIGTANKNRDNYKWSPDNVIMADIDLLIGGSPCQDLSIAKKDRKGLEGSKSSLFREYVRILREVKPKRFILENVASMPQKDRDIITREMGVEPIMINAALVSAQSRKRLFWTNIPGVTLPDDRGILLRDILQDGFTEDLKSYCITGNYAKMTELNYQKGQGQIIKVGHFNKGGQADRVYSPDGKSVTLSALGGGGGGKTGLYRIGNINPSGKGMNGEVYHEDGKSPTLTTNKGEGQKIVQRSRGYNKGGEFIEKSPTLSSNAREQNNKLHEGDIIRKLTPIECERLQSLPDNYTEGVSNSQRYKMLGNAFNVDVIAHILSFIPR